MFEDYIPDLNAIGPELILCGTVLVLLLAELWRMGRDRASVWLSALVLTFLACLGLVWVGSLVNETQFGRGGVALMPEFLGLALAYALVTVGDLFFRGRDRWVPGAIVLLGTLVAGFRLWGLAGPLFEGPGSGFDFWGNLVHADGFSVVFRGFSILSLLVCVWFSIFYRPLNTPGGDRGVGEFLSCLVTAHIGAMFLVQTTNLLFIFLSLEILSLCSYIQAGMLKGDRRSAEAGLKYVVYGSMASGLMLFGFSLLYGLSGSMSLTGIADFLRAPDGGGQLTGPESLILWVGIVASLGGFAYKISAVPFHFWTPDVYEGSPTPTTAFLSVGSKAAAFGILIRFVFAVAGDVSWGPRVLELTALLAALTMTYGNLGALRQSNLKRLLAYSSIAHAGYMLIGVVSLFRIVRDPGTGEILATEFMSGGSEAVVFYLFAYLLMNLGAFGVVIFMANQAGSEEMDDLKGLGWKAPFIGGAMVVFLISLTGVPPTAGFFGKYYVFVAAIDSGYAWLVLVAIVNSVISLFYYFRIAKELFLRSEEEALYEAPKAPLFALSLMALALLTVCFGVFPQEVTSFAKEAAQAFVSR